MIKQKLKIYNTQIKINPNSANNLYIKKVIQQLNQITNLSLVKRLIYTICY